MRGKFLPVQPCPGPSQTFCDTNADARSVCGSGPSCSVTMRTVQTQTDRRMAVLHVGLNNHQPLQLSVETRTLVILLRYPE